MKLLEKESPAERTPIHFLQESCRSGTYQTLSARILQVSYISDKPVRFWQIRHFLQIQTFLARFLDESCKTMSETLIIDILHLNRNFPSQCTPVTDTNTQIRLCYKKNSRIVDRKCTDFYNTN